MTAVRLRGLLGKRSAGPPALFETAQSTVAHPTLSPNALIGSGRASSRRRFSSATFLCLFPCSRLVFSGASPHAALYRAGPPGCPPSPSACS